MWCGDITFIRTQAGWLYLAVVLDLYARKVVGWAFSSVADSQLAQNALTMAWENRGRPKGLMFHSDQGSQYASMSYRDIAKLYGIRLSMSRKETAGTMPLQRGCSGVLKRNGCYVKATETEVKQ
jgi:putative transposase